MSIQERVARLSPAHQALWRLWAEKADMPHGSDSERLVAYVVERPGVAIDEDDLRFFLQYRLPAHMIPSQIIKVAELPRAPSGKLDRRRLKASETARPPHESVAPRDETEQRLADLFEQVLQYQPVGVFDHFFADLGGHSLLATQLISAIRRDWKRDVPLRLLFEHPTVAGLAQALSAVE